MTDNEDPTEWYGMYTGDAGLKRFLSESTNAHPAKMSITLLNNIFRHLEKTGLLQPNDTVIDFMGGTGRTNVLASLKGYRTVSVELEPHFIEMEKENRKVLEARTQRKADWEILQGDARHLSEILGDSRRRNSSVGITSPPYGDTELNYKKNGLKTEGGTYHRPYMEGTEGYNAVGITSSPYSQATDGGGIFKNGYTGDKHSATDLVGKRTYPDSNHNFNSSNIGNLPDKLVAITSPPYEDQLSKNVTDPKFEGRGAWNVRNDYGDSAELLGAMHSETYLSAMLQVYTEAFKAGISPLVTVTKNPTRNGELRRLDLDTARLLEAAGYEIIDYHKAMLFEAKEQKRLFGDTVKKTYHGRLSFFKRVSAQKGNVVADHEDVLIAIIPDAKNSGLEGLL